MKNILSILLVTFLCSSVSAFEEGVIANGEISLPYKFSIEEGVESFLLQVESHSGDDLYIAEVIDPIGNHYVRSNFESTRPISYKVPGFIYSTLLSENRIYTAGGGMGSVLIPNRDNSLPIIPGEWQFRVAFNKKSTSKSKKFNYKINEKKTNISKTMTFIYHLPKKDDYIDDNVISRVLNETKIEYSQMGIYLEFKKGEQSAELGENEGIDSYLGKAQKIKTLNHHIYFLKNKSKISKKFQGLAGCIPGFITLGVDRNCGIIVSAKASEEINEKRMKKVVIHEIAHFLGLFHLSDDYYPYGKVFDTIEDTTGLDDKDNIMSKTSESYDFVNFTEGQKKVILRNPLLFQ